jgi:hypothetical protein
MISMINMIISNDKSPKGLIFITEVATCGTQTRVKTACKAGLATLKILPYRQS